MPAVVPLSDSASVKRPDELRETVSTVAFPDGGRVEITLRDRRDVTTLVPNARAPEVDLEEAHAHLRRAADLGDGSAAFHISRLLAHCGEILPDEAALEDQISQIYSGGSYAGPWGMTLESKWADTDHRPRLETAVRSHFRQCRDIEDRESASSEKWLQRAMESGDSEALKHYGVRAGKSQAAVRAFEEAWMAGEIYATAWLSHLHQHGWTNAAGETVQDPVQAFAYRFLFAELLAAKFRERGHEDIAFAVGARHELDELAHGLRPGELDRAYAAAKSMLQANTKCCLR